MKKLSILYSLVATFVLGGSDLQNYLRDDTNLIFDFQQQQNVLKSGQLSRSWIAPVTVSYQREWKPDATGVRKASDAFSIGIDQPIFKSGGILFGLKYAQALKNATAADIALQKRQMIAQAVELLFNYRKTKLQIEKLRLLVANGAIAIQRQEELYKAGVIDSTVLDQTILAHNRDTAQFLDLELVKQKLRASFSFLSDKNPDKLRLPHLKLISLKRYKHNNLKLMAKRLHAEEKRYGAKMTWTKYLPTVTAYAHYRATDEFTPGTMKGAGVYGIRMSMQFNVNAPSDIEAAKLNELIARAQVRDERKVIRAEYRLVRTSLRILDRKIALARKDEALYRRLLKSTRNLAKAGEKTPLDVQTMENSLAMKKLDRRIFYLEKQLQLLSLYAKVAH